MVPVHSFLRVVYGVWKISASAVYGGELRHSAYDRTVFSVDSVAFLFRDFREISGGRDSAGSERHAAVCDRYLYGSDLARGSGLYSVGMASILHRDLVFLAHRVDDRNGYFGAVLLEKML